MEFEYKAIKIKQTKSNKSVIMFSAPSLDVPQWSGVPQKKRFGTGEETVGFQREESAQRVSSLSEFCQDDENVIQNPLLCATRSIANAEVTFVQDDDEEQRECTGVIKINIPDYSALSMTDVLQQVREYLEIRVPETSGREPDANLIAKLKAAAVEGGLLPQDEVAQDSDELEEGEQEEDLAEAEGALFEESHILDFWNEVACRHETIKLMEEDAPEDEFLGFTKSALETYLKPVVLVDGQHRLSGTIQALKDIFHRQDIQSEIETRIANGAAAEKVEAEIKHRESRRLPISLLVSDDPAEQVFQFVVVNQKATPIGKDLLGTIVSTTLSNSEMAGVSSRLKAAGIELEESQAITYLARYPGSPFSGLVARGLAGDTNDLLQWNVFAGLINIFRGLKGGKLFGYNNDYAASWGTRYLPDSSILADFSGQGYDTPIAYWQALDGPWRDVFVAFYSAIRDKFGQTDNPDAQNYWGKPRKSNLFNKISLTILAADFFQYLTEQRKPLASPDEIETLVDDWLQDVNLNYFARDWSLEGVKKDSTGIRAQWATLWNEYRKNPVALPRVTSYRVAK